MKTAVERFKHHAISFSSNGVLIGFGLCELADAIRSLQPAPSKALDHMILRLAKRKVGDFPCWCSHRTEEMNEIPSAFHEPECESLREYFRWSTHGEP